ncbi:gamma-tubulin complex component protein [Cokeromyces recurvatus]|uniref:gamma-tubulin complex component protein n=1 Tax=Cokeromyces recurvatus TaxID=90255 RepID=UPI002220F9A6|nr:gamma-tubulin complex component protein [Cokeromyces recurvatus]KAI7905244.1 gamma-tubulin complex component protein [Cokeromyces recurvatus]
MLHELLFMLLGHSGDVFVAYPSQHPWTFIIHPDCPLLHPSERESLNRLGQLGWIYSEINQFVNSINDFQSLTLKRTNKPHGAYIRSLTTSIENLLNDYRNEILEMEKRILNKEDDAGGGVIPLALLTVNLNRWQILLPALSNLIRSLKQNPIKYHGCRLFDLLIEESKTGIYEWRIEIEKMIIHLHDVLYRQLTVWMVYGQWVDPDNEFFILPFSEETSLEKDREALSTAGWHRLYVIDYDRVPLHLSRSLVESILFVGKAIATVNEINKLPLSLCQQGDNVSRPIDFMTSSMGKSNRRSTLFYQQKKLQVPIDMMTKHLHLLSSLHSSQHTTPPPLPSSPWIRYPQQLELIVNQIRRSTADWLFSQVLVGEHGLHRYLQSFRNVFLLNYGDLSTNFLVECLLWRQRSLHRSYSDEDRQRRRHNSSSGSSISINNNNNNIHQASKTDLILRHQELNALLGKASIGTEAEDQLMGYSLLVEDKETEQYPFSNLLLEHVRIVLTFHLEWPIDLFLSKDHLKRYSQLWSFLISLKGTEMALKDLWKTDRSNEEVIGKRSIQLNENDEYTERFVWRVRSLMLFWIKTFWSHIQLHVIDSHYQQLIAMTTPSTVAKRRSWQPKAKLDFEEILAAHEEFLNNIMRGCLLESTECVKIMYAILDTCLGFCKLMEQLTEKGELRRNKRRKRAARTASDIVNQWTNNDVNLPWMEKVKSIQEEFNMLTQQFFALASSQRLDVKVSGQLDALLTQLDYNKWFSKTQYTQIIINNT